uniref:Uncharacterized protein n=1 Tax=Davidia involucrata TaxID=16924 RepID=A0A5B6ZLY6_DAVIN
MYKDWGSCTSEMNEAQIREIIARDDKFEFTSFLESSSIIGSGKWVKLKFRESELSLYELFLWICHHGAVHCGTALVEGKPGLEVDLNVPINKGAFPMHEAASSLSAGLVKLFLRHGAQADVENDLAKLNGHGPLPLHAVLERLSSDKNLIKWTPRQSVFKLIIQLCLPKMKEALETVRFLAWNTEQFKEVVRPYAQEGKLIELAILLMVAREKVMAPIKVQRKDEPDGCTLSGYMTLRECIKCELEDIIDCEYRLFGRKDYKEVARLYKVQKMVIKSSLLLLEIFERAGDAFEAYLKLEQTSATKEKVAREVASLLVQAGFILNSKDTDFNDILHCDHKSYPTELFLEESGDATGKEAEESECGSQQQDLRMPLHSQTANYFDTHPKRIMRTESWGLFRTRFSRWSSIVRPFDEPWISKVSFCTGFPKTMEVQVKEIAKETGQYLPTFPLRKHWACIALAVKRGIRYI